jgi:hypothetical protein
MGYGRAGGHGVIAREENRAGTSERIRVDGPVDQGSDSSPLLSRHGHLHAASYLPFLQAANILNLKLSKYMLSTCQDPGILNSATLDKALAGPYVGTSTQASKAELALYGGIVKKYLPRWTRNPMSAATRPAGWPRSSHWPPS